MAEKRCRRWTRPTLSGFRTVENVAQRPRSTLTKRKNENPTPRRFRAISAKSRQPADYLDNGSCSKQFRRSLSSGQTPVLHARRTSNAHVTSGVRLRVSVRPCSPPPRQNWSVTAATTCRQRAHKSRRTGRRFGAEYSVDLLIGRPSVNSLVCTTNTSYPSPGNRRDVIGRKRIYMATTQYEDVYYTK